MIHQPTSVYINWSAYDELSDNVELTEEIAMRQLDELLRLRELGVQFDYYLMDAYWFARDGGYRTWRKPHWPNGPDRWLAECLSHGVKPALWVATNVLSKMEPVPEWEASLDAGRSGACCFYGGFLPHFLETLHLWYERGVRMFKFDFANFGAAPPGFDEVMLPSEIRTANVLAFQGAMKRFRQTHPEVAFVAYNGFEEVHAQSNTSTPYRRSVDLKWLEVFDSMYCGDPRPADVPAMNFWRSKDVYSDHQVYWYAANGMPLERIDNAGFMIGTTGTCYHRGKAAWKGMLLLSLARGGYVNTYYGCLDLLDAEDAAWFAKAQRLFYGLRVHVPFGRLGGVPGRAEPYGYSACDSEFKQGLLAVVNPSQAVATLALPEGGEKLLLFRDAGFEPQLNKDGITLGPEQMALIGVGAYANDANDLGVQDDVTIPSAIGPLAAEFKPDGEKAIVATAAPPALGRMRIVGRQTERGLAKRTSGGSPPKGTSLGKMLTLSASQGGKPVAVDIQYDKAIWSGLSWAVGEIPAERLAAGEPVTVRFSTTEPARVELAGQLFAVEY